MAKQQSDHIENSFRQAAENITVSPNPQAWEKMEELLDQENRRKPIVFWWYLLFVCIVGAAGVFSYQLLKRPAASTSFATSGGSTTPISSSVSDDRGKQQSGDKTEASGSSHKSIVGSGGDATIPASANDAGIPGPGTKMPGANSPSAASGMAKNNQPGNIPKPARDITPSIGGTAKNGGSGVLTSKSRSASTASLLTQKVILKKSGKNLMPNTTDRKSKKYPRRSASGGSNSGFTNERPMTTTLTAEKQQPVQQFLAQANDTAATDLTQLKQGDKSGQAITRNDSTDQATKQDATVQKDSAAQTMMKLKAANDKWKLDRGFNFSIIGELDATSLHHVSLHEFKTLYGLGLGYRFSNRLSVQTGIFVQRAIYFAGPDDYTVKPGTYLSMYKISKIDANCLFYELPLNARYDFLIGKGIRFYGSAGFSSYIMKNESYRYHATGTGGYRMFDSTFTSNKNFFASTYFSAGVEKKISPSFSIQFEPYVKIPNSGVGAGKVKLYSSGLQLSLKFQPVRPKSNRK